jgi:hypothetical protein
MAREGVVINYKRRLGLAQTTGPQAAKSKCDPRNHTKDTNAIFELVRGFVGRPNMRIACPDN